MKIEKITHSLINEHIVDCIKKIEIFLQKLKVADKEKIRITLMFEEILLNLQAKFGEYTELSLILGKKFRRPFITLQINGEQFNPLLRENEGEEDVFLLTPFLQELSMVPIYSYQQGSNKISLIIKPKESFLKKIALYSLAAIILSVIGNFYIQEYFSLIRSVFIKPACDAFLGILTLLCGPLIFFSICTGMLSISTGAEKSLGVGTQVICQYLKKNCVASLFVVVFLAFFFPISFSDYLTANGQNFLKEISKLIFNIIPSNILNPFLQGNTIQISLLAVAAGLVFLTRGKRFALLTDGIIQLNAFFQIVMNIIGEYSHVFIFLLLLSQPISENQLFNLELLKFLIIGMVGYIIYFAFLVISASRRIKILPLFILKAIFPATILGFATSSSTVAYHKMVQACTAEFKIKKSITEFSIPLGMVLGKDGEIFLLFYIVFFAAVTYHVEITLPWVILAAVDIYVIAIATPPVAGGGLVILSALFSQTHIPIEAMPLGIFCSIFLEFYGTAIKVASSILYTVETAFKNKLLETE